MASAELDAPDAPACPLLGLAVDRRTHYTFPHPGHRCFTTQPPRTTAPDRQSGYCLSADFARCDRFIAWMGQGAAGDPSRPSTVSDAPFAQRGSAPSVAPAEVTTAIVVFRKGNTLTRIAASYGLTVQQIVDANRLASPDAVADGERLVIPLSRRPGEGAGRGTRTAGR
jgi:LysM domain